jgi:two-component system sensor histidine kinase GlrK
MRVATKLRAAFAGYITLLGVLLTYHVSTIQRMVATGHELTELSARVRATSMEQVTRVAQLGENAAKYWVTHDPGYLDKFDQLSAAYGAELRHLQDLPLSNRERREIAALATQWTSLGNPTQRLTSFVRLGVPGATQDSLAMLQQALDSLQLQTQRVGEASQAVMEVRLAHSASAASAAEHVSWLAAIGVLLLSLVVSALIARSISEPLQRLTEGTRKVAQGEFDYRLESTRDDEFAQVAHSFNTMTEQLGALDRMKRDFVTRVSHDLKTPLTSMQETISVLLDGVAGPLTEKQRTLLLLNRNSGDRLSDMLSKLLNLSRLEAGIEPELQVVDGAQLLRRAVDQVDGGHDDGAIGIDLALPDARVLLECDPERVSQVVDNLLENAVKFSRRGGTIHVALQLLTHRAPEIPPARWAAVRAQRAPADVAWITVADRGPGVPDADKERIFERFYQTAEGRSVRRRGVGLGLTICREIVNAHGGVIWVGDNPGGGSAFHILLPGAFTPPSEKPAAATPAATHASSTSP